MATDKIIFQETEEKQPQPKRVSLEQPRHEASFRDPAGYVFRKNGLIYRQVLRRHQTHYHHLFASGLYAKLVQDRLLIRHEEVLPFEQKEEYYKTLLPDQIPFVSYPYEWCFSQLKEAALLTLRVQKEALRHNMSLKDASAYNIQFVGCRPVFIDILSFETHQEGKPWVAYRQFCQHFLAPLTLMSKRDIHLRKLLVTYLDGVPLSLATRLLPNRTWFNFGLLIHLHLHHKAQQKLSGSAGSRPGAASGMAEDALLQLADSLEATVSGLRWEPTDTEWADYYGQTNYGAAGMAGKETLVKRYLSQISSSSILDLGANQGNFSQLAAAFAPLTLAADLDPAAVEKHFLKLKDKRAEGIFPLLLDITNPSPAIGWNNQERVSFWDRVKADTILALALIHHLTIGNNVPLSVVAGFFADKCRHLIIEFIPKEDSQVQKMLMSREIGAMEYSVVHFEEAFAAYFAIREKEPIRGTERFMYLLQRKEDALF